MNKHYLAIGTYANLWSLQNREASQEKVPEAREQWHWSWEFNTSLLGQRFAQLIHLSLLPPSAGNNPSLPCLQSSSREANITHCSIATMLQLRAKSISNLRAQQPQLPSQPGPSSIREAKDHPSQNKETELFLHRHSGLGATQRKHLPSHPQSSRFWNKPEYHGHCVSSRRGQDAQTAALPEFWWYKCYF